MKRGLIVQAFISGIIIKGQRLAHMYCMNVYYIRLITLRVVNVYNMFLGCINNNWGLNDVISGMCNTDCIWARTSVNII